MTVTTRAGAQRRKHRVRRTATVSSLLVAVSAVAGVLPEAATPSVLRAGSAVLMGASSVGATLAIHGRSNDGVHTGLVGQ